ncbi:hypothetical protein BC628DRAFT_1104302 [Trametes gibbosa]|nr:hypothetical protein BC628DRAFT_1104302 [Trametes gibbosa]
MPLVINPESALSCDRKYEHEGVRGHGNADWQLPMGETMCERRSLRTIEPLQNREDGSVAVLIVTGRWVFPMRHRRIPPRVLGRSPSLQKQPEMSAVQCPLRHQLSTVGERLSLYAKAADSLLAKHGATLTLTSELTQPVAARRANRIGELSAAGTLEKITWYSCRVVDLLTEIYYSRVKLAGGRRLGRSSRISLVTNITRGSPEAGRR